jgi:hypothetical protein
VFNLGSLWPEFFAYLKPILDIERTDRDDVFRKSNKFDRPDFGNNIPFELFSALTSLHMSQKHDKDEKDGKDEKDDNDAFVSDENEYKTDDHEEGEAEHAENEGEAAKTAENENAGQEELPEVPHHDKEHDEVTIDLKTTAENPPDSQERVVPQEFEVRLKHSKSIDEQVIETRQDNDLIEEREEAKHLREEEEHKKEELAQQSETKPTETPSQPEEPKEAPKQEEPEAKQE